VKEAVFNPVKTENLTTIIWKNG